VSARSFPPPGCRDDQLYRLDPRRAGDFQVAAAQTLKRVTLELGGKGANLVFADADDKAVERGVRHMMDNTGQSCNAPSRMLVERRDLRPRGRRSPPRSRRWDQGRQCQPNPVRTSARW
jgi:acyl-CoA reductase-like NAD-dependent aldehyde dehydrogenase